MDVLVSGSVYNTDMKLSDIPISLANDRALDLRSAILAQPPGEDVASSVSALMDYATAIAGALPGVRKLVMAAISVGLEPSVKRFPAYMCVDADEASVIGFVRGFGEALHERQPSRLSTALLSGHPDPDVLTLFRICAYLQIVFLPYDASAKAGVMDRISGPDVSSSPERAVELHDLKRAITGLLIGLSAKEERVLRLLFGIGVYEHTLEEIGATFGVTRSRVQQIGAHALRRLWSRAMDRGLDGVMDAQSYPSAVGSSASITPRRFGCETVLLAVSLGLDIDAMALAMVRTGVITGSERRNPSPAVIESAAYSLRRSRVPGSFSAEDLVLEIGCGLDVVAMLIANGRFLPISHDNVLKIGVRYHSDLPRDFISELLAGAECRPPKDTEFPIRRAATIVGCSETDVVRHIFRTGLMVTSYEERSYSSAKVDVLDLAQSLVEFKVRDGHPLERVAALPSVVEECRSIARYRSVIARAKVAAPGDETAGRRMEAASQSLVEIRRRADKLKKAEAARLKKLAKERAKAVSREASREALAAKQISLTNEAIRKARAVNFEAARRGLERLRLQSISPSSDLSAPPRTHSLVPRHVPSSPPRSWTIRDFAQAAIVSTAVVLNLVRNGRLGPVTGSARSSFQIGHDDAVRFLRTMVSIDEILQAWKKGEHVVSILSLANVSPKFPVETVGTSFYSRDYVMKVAASLGSLGQKAPAVTSGRSG